MTWFAGEGSAKGIVSGELGDHEPRDERGESTSFVRMILWPWLGANDMGHRDMSKIVCTSTIVR